MLYALTHPGRTVRWWRYRIAHAVAEPRRAIVQAIARRRRAFAALSDRQERAPRPTDTSGPAPERGELIGRSFIGRDGEMTALPLPGTRDDRFDPRPSLLPPDHENRRRAW